MEQLNLRVKSNRLVICVNDDGDTITLNLDDHRVLDKFKEFANFGKKHPFNKDEDEETAYEKISDYTKKLSGMIDDLFGDGATHKIFGVCEPTIDLIADFVYQLEPFVLKGVENKTESIRKQKDKYERRSNKREIKRR